MSTEGDELPPLSQEQGRSLDKDAAITRILGDAVSVAKTIIDPDERRKSFVSLIDTYGFLAETASSAVEYDLQARSLLEQIPQTGLSRLQYLEALTRLAKRGNDTELRKRALTIADDKEWADAVAKREQLAAKAKRMKSINRHWVKDRSTQLLEQAHAIATSEELPDTPSFATQQTGKFLAVAQAEGAEVSVITIKGELEGIRHRATDHEKALAAQGIQAIALGLQQGDIQSSNSIIPSKKVTGGINMVKK